MTFKVKCVLSGIRNWGSKNCTRSFMLLTIGILYSLSHLIPFTYRKICEAKIVREAEKLYSLENPDNDDTKKAIALYKEALEVNASNKTIEQCIDTLIACHANPLARQARKLLVTREPDNPEYIYCLAVQRWRNGYKMEAFDLMSFACTIAPDKSGYWEYMAHWSNNLFPQSTESIDYAKHAVFAAEQDNNIDASKVRKRLKYILEKEEKFEEEDDDNDANDEDEDIDYNVDDVFGAKK